MKRKRVFLCSMDGVRPDAIAAAHTPTIDRLVREGSHTWKARTVMPSVTLPCHTSMLRGVVPERHGITDNLFLPLARPVPSVIDVARQAGRSTGFCYNWEQLRDLAAPGSLNFSFFYKYPLGPQGGNSNYAASEPDQMKYLCEMLAAMDLDFLFLYICTTDAAGHDYGWMSAEYLQAVEWADHYLGVVLDRIAELGRAQETCTLLLSDHGGHARTHGTEMDEDMTIPWILHGPGIKQGYEITGPVRIYDTCTTIAHLLDVPRNDQWEGAVIDEAFTS